VILNLSPKAQTTTLTEATGQLRDVFAGTQTEIAANTEIKLGPWEYRVLSSN
jgi:hypothetical protein